MKQPLVSIGIPIYNEEQFLAEALDSLATQSYKNIELIISDNASTDQTERICKQFAKEFSTIQYKRLDENIGAAANFRAVSQRATGKYFMWAAGHDLWSENLISECVTALEKNDNATIAFATSIWIDEYSAPLDTKSSGWADTRGLHPIARFYTILWGNMHPILGLIRNKHLKESKEFQSTLGADLIMLAELSLKGEFVHAIKAHWSRRMFREEETYRERVNRYRSKNYSLIDGRFSKLFPIMLLPIELIKVVYRSNLGFLEKLINILVLLPTMFLKFLVSR